MIELLASAGLLSFAEAWKAASTNSARILELPEIPEIMPCGVRTGGLPEEGLQKGIR